MDGMGGNAQVKGHPLWQKQFRLESMESKYGKQLSATGNIWYLHAKAIGKQDSFKTPPSVSAPNNFRKLMSREKWNIHWRHFSALFFSQTADKWCWWHIRASPHSRGRSHNSPAHPKRFWQHHPIAAGPQLWAETPDREKTTALRHWKTTHPCSLNFSTSSMGFLPPIKRIWLKQ